MNKDLSIKERMKLSKKIPFNELFQEYYSNYYKFDNDIDKVFKNEFLRLENYNDISQIKSKFNSLKTISDTLNLSEEDKSNSEVYLIKSFNLDDIHKSIKYGVYNNNNETNNNTLNEAYKKLKNKGKIFLIFISIPFFCIHGICEIVSSFNEENHFNLWNDKNHLSGMFLINWLMIKNCSIYDLNDSIFEKTKIKLDNFFDCDKISIGYFNELVDFYNKYDSKSSIFSIFKFLDHREDDLIKLRGVLDFEIKLTKLEIKPIDPKTPKKNKKRNNKKKNNNSNNNSNNFFYQKKEKI